ncbi:DUF6952 family protein [Persephonella sp.]
MNIKEIRELAKKFSVEELENCISETIENGKNSCDLSGDVLEVVNTLAKAQTVKELMEQGMTEMEAIRELAKRIRAVQGL